MCGKLRTKTSKWYCEHHRVTEGSRALAWQAAHRKQHLARLRAYAAKRRAQRKAAGNGPVARGRKGDRSERGIIEGLLRGTPTEGRSGGGLPQPALDGAVRFGYPEVAGAVIGRAVAAEPERFALVEALEKHIRAVRVAIHAANQRAEGEIPIETYQQAMRMMDATRLRLKEARLRVFGQS